MGRQSMYPDEVREWAALSSIACKIDCATCSRPVRRPSRFARQRPMSRLCRRFSDHLIVVVVANCAVNGSLPATCSRRNRKSINATEQEYPATHWPIGNLLVPTIASPGSERLWPTTGLVAPENNSQSTKPNGLSVAASSPDEVQNSTQLQRTGFALAPATSYSVSAITFPQSSKERAVCTPLDPYVRVSSVRHGEPFAETPTS